MCMKTYTCSLCQTRTLYFPCQHPFSEVSEPWCFFVVGIFENKIFDLKAIDRSVCTFHFAFGNPYSAVQKLLKRCIKDGTLQSYIFHVEQLN